MQHPAAETIRRAANELHAAVYPGDEIRGPREDLDPFSADALDRAISLLTKAEDQLDTGVGGGEPSVVEGMKLVEEASDAIESTRAFARRMPREVGMARADALRLLDRVTGRS